MKNKKKLILIEAEMKGPKGHFLNNLIDTTKAFNNKFDIYWILNKNFDDNGTYIPKNISIDKIINTNRYKRKKNKILYLLEEIYNFFLNLIYINIFLLTFFKEKKLFRYLIALKSNFFLLPRYFVSFYRTYKLLKFTKNDHIFFPTARRRDIALINFLIKIDQNHPKFHIRVMLPPKNRFKSFFYYLREIDKQLKNERAFVYLWSDFNYKLFIKNSLSKKGIFISNIPWTFFKRKLKTKNHIIGYMGDARPSRGFQYLPDIIEKLKKKKHHLKFLIQFSKITDDLIKTKERLYKLSKKNKNIKIIEKYSDYQKYINHLKKIDIMPILHNAEEINKITSGTMYSCIPYEIPMIIPSNTLFMKKILKFKSYEKAKNINEFVNKIIKISKNYKYYHGNVKKNSLILKKILRNDPLRRNII
ncbi:hypothetical protein OAS12_04555 [Candidatus Pelagibacter ubique]|nr:hypothetical protein [Candidatus Pelagibacter ubique]